MLNSDIKISLLITGQIRDKKIFEDIIYKVSKVSHLFENIVFSTWYSEIAGNRSLIKKLSPYAEIVNCSRTPIGVDLAPEMVSFFAQHQQICNGFKYIHKKAIILRIRADKEYFIKEDINHLVNSIKSFKFKKYNLKNRLVEKISESINWNNPYLYSYNFPLIVSNLGKSVPFFFKDLEFIIGGRFRESIQDIKITDIYGHDPFNLFPEYLFFSKDFINLHPYLKNYCNSNQRLYTQLMKLRTESSHNISIRYNRNEIKDFLKKYESYIKHNVFTFYDLCKRPSFRSNNSSAHYLNNTLNFFKNELDKKLDEGYRFALDNGTNINNSIDEVSFNKLSLELTLLMKKSKFNEAKFLLSKEKENCKILPNFIQLLSLQINYQLKAFEENYEIWSENKNLAIYNQEAFLISILSIKRVKGFKEAETIFRDCLPKVIVDSKHHIEQFKKLGFTIK